ncbi:MAG: hypothetical protein IJN68_00775 [Clostridia bacterium]|nr:hypothetical protein [Clostridia bacterium]
MKFKSALIIPLVAILIALCTLGATPGAAADTTVSDSLTYVPTTLPPTSSLDEEIEGMVSNMFGDDLQNAEGPIRGLSEVMAGLLNSIRNVLNSIIKIFQTAGGMLGNSGAFQGGIF